MSEFWESNFKDKQEMWGMEPADSAIGAMEIFKDNGLNKILIPGFGYGRNAKIFIDNGFNVTGIEISETAIELAKNHFGDSVKVYHGSVSAMPYDQEMYDGIFCYALIHLLNTNERKKLIIDCYNQLKSNGYMVFVVISKNDSRFGKGKKVTEDSFETHHGVTLYFYDVESIKKEFGEYGLVKCEEIWEPKIKHGNKPSQRFMTIICRK